ncbi:MAG: hypothetical protein GF398_17225 [Chitinivibrionales bacterium]|nr:hypothetical protein [Chitinivibrionales bacterium]
MQLLLIFAATIAYSVNAVSPDPDGSAVANALVNDFNAEVKKDRPDFDKLEKIQNDMTMQSRPKAAELGKAIRERSEEVANVIIDEIESALKKGDAGSARQDLNYLNQNQKRFGIPFDTSVDFERRAQALEQAGQGQDQIEQGLNQIDDLLKENRVGNARNLLNHAEVKFNKIRNELSRDVAHTFEKQIKQQKSALDAKEKELVEANMRILRTSGPDDAITFRKNVIAKARLSQSELQKLDNALTKAKQNAKARKDSTRAAQVRLKAEQEEKALLEKLRREKEERERKKLEAKHDKEEARRQAKLEEERRKKMEEAREAERERREEEARRREEEQTRLEQARRDSIDAAQKEKERQAKLLEEKRRQLVEARKEDEERRRREQEELERQAELDRKRQQDARERNERERREEAEATKRKIAEERRAKLEAQQKKREREAREKRERLEKLEEEQRRLEQKREQASAAQKTEKKKKPFFKSLFTRDNTERDAEKAGKKREKELAKKEKQRRKELARASRFKPRKKSRTKRAQNNEIASSDMSFKKQKKSRSKSTSALSGKDPRKKEAEDLVVKLYSLIEQNNIKIAYRQFSRKKKSLERHLDKEAYDILAQTIESTYEYTIKNEKSR